MTRARLTPPILSAWAAAAAVLLLVHAGRIGGFAFFDPDDVMRLVAVRDLLSGQSWWDVDQHRLGGGSVFAMHWSRLVDLPLAAVAWMLEPLLGDARSMHVAVVAIPLLTLLAIMALAALLTARLSDRSRALMALLIVPITAPILAQAQPMRIDHHGWQVVCALAATLALVARPGARSGIAVGIALAALITISLEGLPIAVAIAAVAVLGWVVDPARAGQARWTVLSLFGAAALLHLATRGPGFWEPACDAVAPAWLAGLGIAAIGVTGATLAGRARPPLVRLALLGGTGIAALAALAAIAPDCLASPFDRLDPLVRLLWFDHVTEGLPLWRQQPLSVALALPLPLLGLAGAVFAAAHSEGAARANWLRLLALQVASLVLAILVLRAGATANALAVPAAAQLAHAALLRARAMRSMPKRLVATIAALFVAAPGLLVAALVMAPAAIAARPDNGAAASARTRCTGGADAAALAALPPGRIFAPLDLSPDILARTRHSAIASGYHRNDAAMRLVIEGYTATPEIARDRIMDSGADYLVACPGLDEQAVYIAAAPEGLLARLDRDAVPHWLRPVALPGSPIRIWRIVRD